MRSLKQKLDRLYNEYDFEGRKGFDPIELPHRYSDPRDIELSGFLASCFAYGRVDLFKPIVKSILDRMGASPYDFLSRFSSRNQKDLFSGLKYRFNSEGDILALLYVLGRAIKRHGSLESLFKQHYRSSDDSISAGLSGMIDFFTAVDTSSIHTADTERKGFLQFFPSPLSGSACKRMNMFLRWMVRDRDIDFGIWKGIPKNKLIIPLDVHIARISRCLGLTNRASQDWKTAVEITGSLKAMDPEDPLKYDFALCHQGIARICKSGCDGCALFKTR